MTDNVKAIAVQRFNVPPQRVYDAILDPAMIARFMFGPLLREEEILHIRNQPEVGGRFSFKVRRGQHEIDHVGSYLELTPPTRIVFTWAIAPEEGGSTVFVDIVPTNDGCELTLVHEMAPQWSEYVERSRAGWQKMFGVLATLL
ncbi:MAG TPA: SRPBCC family protein [Hyphomonadaceae bacterium]|nr:SRPBCC family protein [Hyphomonadaceae bacterium]HPI46662.1 SRPBCC family protein [Hyphomonadaceae bacterium]